MITLFGIPNCDSVKKARTWLDTHQIVYTFHNYKKEGIDTESLEQWCAQAGWEQILNRKGTTWRTLSEEEKASATDAPSAIRLMQVHTSLIKRPVITRDKEVIAVGYSETSLERLHA